jgi:hypothetical protein
MTRSDEILMRQERKRSTGSRTICRQGCSTVCLLRRLFTTTRLCCSANWTHHLTTRKGCKLTTRFLAQTPPNILPAQTFLTRFLSLLQPASSILSVEGSDVQITSSPTLNFLQMAILTCQRAPAPGVSGVQARGTDGGVGREWEGLVGRYRRVSGAQGFLAQKEVLEVSPYRLGR